MAYCEIPFEGGRTKGTNCYSWSFSHPLEKASTIADCGKSVHTPTTCVMTTMSGEINNFLENEKGL
jgi:hypothetical protein